MEQINSLILYKDWLMPTRGKIEPRVGDKVIPISHIGISLSPFEVKSVNKDIQDSDLWHIIIFEDNSGVFLSNCYVKVSYPVIKWKHSLGTWLKGYINNIPVLTIDFEIINGEINRNNCTLREINFKGTLEECKIKANKLLYETTE